MKKLYSLVGIDGNAFVIMGYVETALRQEGMQSLIDDYLHEAKQGDYQDLLNVSQDYLNKANNLSNDEA